VGGADLILLAFMIVLAVLARAGYIDAWFGGYLSDPDSKPNLERAKTLWDWMDLLLVPILLAPGVWLLNRAARTREHETEGRRIKEQQNIELERLREAALQTCLVRMTELIGKGSAWPSYSSA
jgi:hypothetical protein